ncbi:hypothetical protein M0812_28794 [Anaeramoeba flamelloides]|uniref:Uncharacterized protein n=1 Tax=Anaeramoeba flamelloides TaxID=1746091 RepID=A0AAV7YE30_9EUKA|nr:hypothetical protein M0812_28794 [Anaeramoeba flamelloides]
MSNPPKKTRTRAPQGFFEPTDEEKELFDKLEEGKKRILQVSLGQNWRERFQDYSRHFPALFILKRNQNEDNYNQVFIKKELLDLVCVTFKQGRQGVTKGIDNFYRTNGFYRTNKRGYARSYIKKEFYEKLKIEGQQPELFKKKRKRTKKRIKIQRLGNIKRRKKLKIHDQTNNTAQIKKKDKKQDLEKEKEKEKENKKKETNQKRIKDDFITKYISLDHSTNSNPSNKEPPTILQEEHLLKEDFNFLEKSLPYASTNLFEEFEGNCNNGSSVLHNTLSQNGDNSLDKNTGVQLLLVDNEVEKEKEREIETKTETETEIEKDLKRNVEPTEQLQTRNHETFAIESLQKENFPNFKTKSSRTSTCESNVQFNLLKDNQKTNQIKINILDIDLSEHSESEFDTFSDDRDFENENLIFNKYDENDIINDTEIDTGNENVSVNNNHSQTNINDHSDDQNLININNDFLNYMNTDIYDDYDDIYDKFKF